MKSITRIELEALRLYKSLEIGIIFNAFHDIMLSNLDEFDYLEQNNAEDLIVGLEILEKFKKIILAQNILLSI